MGTLRKRLDLITYSIKQSAFPYLFVVSDDIEIRNYFIDNIARIENVSVIDDNKMENDETLMNELNEKNVLLLNADIKAEQLRILNNYDESYNSLYYRLVFKREFLWRNRKTIIVVADEKTITPLLQGNQSLASTSSFHFIDDHVREDNIIEEDNALIKSREKIYKKTN